MAWYLLFILDISSGIPLFRSVTPVLFLITPVCALFYTGISSTPLNFLSLSLCESKHRFWRLLLSLSVISGPCPQLCVTGCYVLLRVLLHLSIELFGSVFLASENIPTPTPCKCIVAVSLHLRDPAVLGCSFSGSSFSWVPGHNVLDRCEEPREVLDNAIFCKDSILSGSKTKPRVDSSSPSWG